MQPHQFNWLEEELVINIQPSVVALFSLLADVLVLCHEHLVRVRHGPDSVQLPPNATWSRPHSRWILPTDICDPPELETVRVDDGITLHR